VVEVSQIGDLEAVTGALTNNPITLNRRINRRIKAKNEAVEVISIGLLADNSDRRVVNVGDSFLD